MNLSTDGGYGRPSGGGRHQHSSYDYWTPPSLPSSPARERRLPATPGTAETPILDALSSRRQPYGGDHNGGGHNHGHNGRNLLTGSDHSLLSLSDGSASVTYDYHTAQLDMFLEEYKNLRKELTKMKRTCDTLRLSNASLASSVTGGGVGGVLDAVKPDLPAAASAAVRTTPKSILKNKNQATYVYRNSGDRRRNSYHLLDAAPDDVYLG